jgi:L-alanine-DL-glutamate epimerase-like enolase superfamily enzyme
MRALFSAHRFREAPRHARRRARFRSACSGSSAALPEVLLLEMQFDETPAFASIVAGHLPMPEAGIAAVPDAPGLGLRLVAGDLDEEGRL